MKRTVYESSLVITNPSSIPMKVQVIHEIPQGSIPVYSLDTMKIEYITLSPLQSQNLSMNFYFPSAGTFGCYPATVVQNNEILGIATIEKQIVVKEKKVITELISMADVLSSGDIQNIKEFLLARNLTNPNIFRTQDILGLLKNKEYFDIISGALRERGFYDKQVWKYSILHGDLNAFKEYLNDLRI